MVGRTSLGVISDTVITFYYSFYYSFYSFYMFPLHFSLFVHVF